MTKGTLIRERYRLVGRLDEGAMGEVWSALDVSTGGEVALKLLRQESAELRRRLLFEGHACGKLRHPNIVTVHDVGETDDGKPFLVMELLTGETLAHLLVRMRRITQARAAQIGRDIARALSAAHGAGIVHRDLKPANVFLHREGGRGEVVVKVLDFGIGKSLERSESAMTAAGCTIGSPAYMSPEQARADPALDHRTDVWSLGVVLFEMLVGKRLFDGEPHQILVKIAIEPIPAVSQFVRSVDPRLAAIVSRCLERDVAQRIGSAGEVEALLDAFVRPGETRLASGSGQAQAPLLAPRSITMPPATIDEENAPTREWSPRLVQNILRPAQAPEPGQSSLPEPSPPLDATLPPPPRLGETAPFRVPEPVSAEAPPAWRAKTVPLAAGALTPPLLAEAPAPPPVPPGAALEPARETGSSLPPVAPPARSARRRGGVAALALSAVAVAAGGALWWSIRLHPPQPAMGAAESSVVSAQDEAATPATSAVRPPDTDTPGASPVQDPVAGTSGERGAPPQPDGGAPANPVAIATRKRGMSPTAVSHGGSVRVQPPPGPNALSWPKKHPGPQPARNP